MVMSWSAHGQITLTKTFFACIPLRLSTPADTLMSRGREMDTSNVQKNILSDVKEKQLLSYLYWFKFSEHVQRTDTGLKCSKDVQC